MYKEGNFKIGFIPKALTVGGEEGVYFNANMHVAKVKWEYVLTIAERKINPGWKEPLKRSLALPKRNTLVLELEDLVATLGKEIVVERMRNSPLLDGNIARDALKP